MYKIASELCRQGIRGVLGKAGTPGFVCAGVLCRGAQHMLEGVHSKQTTTCLQLLISTGD